MPHKAHLLARLKPIFKSASILFRISILISITLFASHKTFSFQDFRSSLLTQEDGLSLNLITKVLQDSRGFLWFGTYNGLNRYDGYSIKNYLPDLSDPGSISNHSIWVLYEDRHGYLWVGTLNGLNRYDWRKDKFYRYEHNPADKNSLSNNYCFSIYEDTEGNLWIGTLNGLNKYNREKDNFTVYEKVSETFNTNSLNSVLCIDEDYLGNLWLGTWKGLTCIQKNKEVKHFTLPSQDKNRLLYNNISIIKEDKYKNLWIGTHGNGIYRYDLKSNVFIHYSHIEGNINSLTDDYVNTLYEDKFGNLWVGTRKGLSRYDHQKDCFTQNVDDDLKPLNMESIEVFSMTEDRTGILWIGTVAGAAKFYQSTNYFEIFTGNGLHNLKTRIEATFIDRNENTWLGTSEGLYKVDNLTRVIRKLNIGLPDNSIHHIFEDHSGKLWIGTNSGGLVCYDPILGKTKIYKYNDQSNESISNNGVLSIAEDDSGFIWVGTWWGLNRLDRKTGKFTRYIDKFRNNGIWVIYKSSDGLLWFGTDGGGLGVYNPHKGEFNSYFNDQSGNNIAGNRVISIFESSDKTIWFGTTEGLSNFNPGTKKFKNYYKKDGLPSVLINGIQEDTMGRIWIVTDNGLSVMDKKTDTFINFGKRDGLDNVEFVPGSSAKTKDYTFFFGTTKGLLIFNPAKIKYHNFHAPLVLTDFKIFNQSVPISEQGILKESVTAAKLIELPPGNEMITFEFALLDFSDVKKNAFQYKLVGFDQDWNRVGVRNNATYTNLPPGEYRFVLRANTDNGLLNEKEVSLKVIVVPSFHQTAWFKTILAFGLLFTMGVIFQLRTKSIKLQNKVLEEKVAERTKDLDRTITELNTEIASKDKFFSIIAHDLRSPFSALLGLSKYLVDEVDNISRDELKYVSENILSSTEHTFGLLENLLHWARVKTGRINFEPKKINLKKIIEPLLVLYKSNAANKNIRLTSSIDENIFVFADINTLETVVRNFISNAIKFSNEGGEIIVSACDEKDYVKVLIKDSGIGIPADILAKLFQINYTISTLGTHKEKGSGLGLILCKEFIELNGGQISVDSIPGIGSEFGFTLHKNHKQAELFHRQLLL